MVCFLGAILGDKWNGVAPQSEATVNEVSHAKLVGKCSSMSISGIWSKGRIQRPSTFDLSLGQLGLIFGPYTRRFDSDRYLFALEGQAFDTTPDALRDDERKLETAYGYYVYVRWDRMTEEAAIGSDRLGYFPFYYAFEDDRFVFSTSIDFVKSALRRRSPDYEAWEELLVLGEVIGDKTPVREISRLAVGTRIRITQCGVSFCRFWTPELPETVDEKTYVQKNNLLLDEAMALTASQSRAKVIMLSGGEDSRRLALAAARAGMKCDCFTQEAVHRGNVDIDSRLAREVATHLGLPFAIEPLPSPEQRLADYKTRDNLLGFECAAHEWLLPLIRRIPRQSLVYDGIIGDVTINGHYFKQFPDAIDQYRNLGALARMICGAGDRRWVAEFNKHARVSIVDRVCNILATYPDSPHRLTFYFLFNHTRRKISLLGQLLAAYGHWTCYPYAYFPLFLQSLSLDPRLQIGKFYQRECMTAIAPEIASIPTTRSEIPSQYLVDMAREANEHDRYLRTHLRIDKRASEMFPLIKNRTRLMRLFQSRVGWPLLKRFGWFLVPVARYSAFLDWLDSDHVAGSNPSSFNSR